MTSTLRTVVVWAFAMVMPVGLYAAAATPDASAIPDKVQFNRDVRPILMANCLKCHGPDATGRKKGLRLDDRDVATTALADSAIAIVPGKPDASEMIKRITSTDPEHRMPYKKPALSAHDIAILRKWIAQGAVYQKFWSFVAPVKPKLPDVGDSKWPRNEIDYFTLAKMHEAGLDPAPEASKTTLVRRLYLDLTGLPPTLEQIDQFVNDKSPDAYEHLVDRLLADPHYGEHMTRYWLDVVRYADTHGLHFDAYREIWPYRDYIIRAFNSNMPYDRFVKEQLAGDLLPNPTTDQLVASGYNRCNLTNNEGGSINEEVYVRNVMDRTKTTGEAFLGLTVGCAVCHDHKYDPITQKDFYSLFAFFNNLDGAAMDGNKKDPAPYIRVPTPEITQKIAALKSQLADLDKKADADAAKIDYVDPFAAGKPADLQRQTITWVDDDLPPGAKPQGDGLVWITADQGPVHSGKRSMKRVSQGNQQHFFDQCDKPLHVGAGDKFFAWVYLDPKSPPKEIMLQYHSSGWLHRAYWGANLIPYGQDHSTQRVHMGELPPTGQWVRLEVDAAKVGIAPGTAITGMAFTQYDGTAYWDDAGLQTLSPQDATDYVWIDDDLPNGAKADGGRNTWHWGGEKQQPVFAGLRSLKHTGKGTTQDVFTGATPRLVIHPGDKLFAHVYIDPKRKPAEIMLQFNDGNWEHRAYWGDDKVPFGKNGTDSRRRIGDLPEPGHWVRLEIDPAQVGLKPGDKINGWAFTQFDGLVYWDKAGVNTFNPPDDRAQHSLVVWAQQYGPASNVPEPVRNIAKLAPEKRTDAQAAQLKDYYIRYVFADTRDQFDPINDQAKALQKQVTDAENAMPTTLVMKERPEPRKAWVLKRGEYDQHGDPVTRRTPGFLPPMTKDMPHDRLGFAEWLIARDNPLTSRVEVNRLWQQLFGTGIVKTSEDFGTQGSGPSDQALLDYLAVQFMDDGWDIKKTVKRIVMSATYRQSSTITPEKLKADPANRLLARGPRFRLDAETIRDQALMLGGLLVDQMYGPSVKPPQPGGLWETGYVGSNTHHFVADTGSKIYRRSLYTFWKRTSPPPPMTTFDAPSREECTLRRERTDTPLQALVLMDEVEFVQCAKGLATRTMHEGGATPEQRVAWMFHIATGRPASQSELTTLLDNYQQNLDTYKKDPSSAKQLVEFGPTKPDNQLDPVQLAAWTMTANVVLNLDETINKS